MWDMELNACRWYTMTAADGSVSETWDYLKQNGVQGFLNIWPRPTATACKIIVVYAVFEAALQLLLPAKTVYGPISPTGHRPVYKVNTSHTFHLSNPLLYFTSIITLPFPFSRQTVWRRI